MKRAAIAVMFISACFASSAMADDGTRQAYDAALKCFVANGLVSGDFRDQGKVDQAQLFDAKAHADFDLAVKFGKELGYSNKKINGDFDSAKASELPRMMRDSAYYKTTAATCKALGLM